MPDSILLVDDEVGILLAFQKLLRTATREVDTASTMVDAEAQLKSKNYRVVIADLRLTGVLGTEGLEIIKYVREHNPGTHVILITGYGSPEIMNKAFELGADYYFEKPVRSDVLRGALQELGVE